MVNVPGRSKGCQTCRTRKIKCSLERPRCLQCAKSKRICLGYQRDTVFVNSNIGTEARKAHTILKGKLLEDNEVVSPQALAKTASKIQPEEKFDRSCQFFGSVTSLVSSSMRQQMLASLSPSPGASDARNWMTHIASIPSPLKALESAAHAISLAKLSIALDAPKIGQESRKQYTQSLHHLQKALSQSVCGDEILGTCMLLAMYEVFECPNNSKVAYHSHFHGCARLIQSRGPDMYTEGFGFALFQGFRLMGALEGLRTKSSFLSDPSWMTVPFTKQPNKAPLQKVLDLLLEGSSILRRADHLQSIAEGKRLRYAADLLQDCIALDGDMESFLQNLEASLGGKSYWAVLPSKMFVAHNDFEFPDLRTATTLILSWATLTILWSGICHLYEFLSQETILVATMDGKLIGHFLDTKQQFELPQSTRFREFPTMARNVLGAVAYCLQDEWGIPATVAPLNMIIDALSSWTGFEKEITEANRILDMVERNGMRIVKHVRK